MIHARREGSCCRGIYLQRWLECIVKAYDDLGFVHPAVYVGVNTHPFNADRCIYRSDWMKIYHSEMLEVFR